MHNSPHIRLDIQGLRAIAVLSVVLFHAWPSALPGGYIGVDVFFVISGYLISSILIKDIERGRFSIVEFYRRRIARIFPALFLMLAAVAAAGYVVLTPAELKELGRNLVSTTFFVSNIDFWLLTGYFDGAADLKPLLHTWSLAVEEQFYIVYPPLLYLLFRRLGRARVTRLAVGGAVLGLAFSELAVNRWPTAAYFLAPARAFELLIGCALACGDAKALPPRWAATASMLGLALIVGPLAIYTSATPFPGIAAAIPTLGTALVIWAGSATQPVGNRLISSLPFRFFGDISYSFYLWHWPVLAYARNLYGLELPPLVAAAAVLLALLLSLGSFHLVEQPVLRRRLPTATCFQYGALANLGAVALAAVFALGQGLPSRFTPDVHALFEARNDFNALRAKCHNDAGQPIPYARNCVYGAADAEPDLAVWGDSHGTELVAALGEQARLASRSILQITASACPPALGFKSKERPHCDELNRQTLDGLLADPRIKTVLLVANPARYDQQALEQGFQQTVQHLSAGGKKIILSSAIPVMTQDPPAFIGRAQSLHQDLESLGRPRPAFEQETRRWQSFTHALQARYQTGYLDPSAALCDSARCHMYRHDTGVLYFNSDHLSLKGAALVTRELARDIYMGVAAGNIPSQVATLRVTASR
jgi:peptidoglycan/LPS O-acetylase OafA/YrhL